MFANIAADFSTFLCFMCIIGCNCRSIDWVLDDYGCRTPDHGTGNCISIKKCQSMLNFIRKVPKPTPIGIRNKLSEYMCGFEGKDMKVCCTEGPIPIPLPPIDRVANLKNENDITNHSNLDLLPKECGYAGIPDKISHGNNASLGEFPWMALLSYSTPRGPEFKCGGTVINNKYILTAAHCITELKGGMTLSSVRVGEYDISTEKDCEIQDDDTLKCAPKPVQDLAIEKIIPHPNFNRDYDGTDSFNDIGLIRVASEIEFQPICLPTGKARKSNLSRVSIAGWGFTEKATKISNILQTVSVPVLEQSKCQKAFENIFRISHKQICAYGAEKDSCSGDSGGPLQTQKQLYDDIRSVQYGVISFGSSFCGSGGLPGVYTRVDSYMKWILDNIKP